MIDSDDVLKTLIELLEAQEKIKITYTTAPNKEKKGAEND